MNLKNLWHPCLTGGLSADIKMHNSVTTPRGCVWHSALQTSMLSSVLMLVAASPFFLLVTNVSVIALFMTLEVWLCMHTFKRLRVRSHASRRLLDCFPWDSSPLTHWCERDKWPLLITKWIELCDGHIRPPQEKHHVNNMMWFSAVVMGDKCFLSVHPPSLHPSIRKACLPKPSPRRYASKDDKKTTSVRREGWRGGGVCLERWGMWGGRMPLCIALRPGCPQVCEILVSFGKAEKWNGYCDRESCRGNKNARLRLAES